MNLALIAPQPKEFYADPSVIDDSNQKLEGVDSRLRLVLSATRVTVPVPGKRGVTTQLRKVQPTMAGPTGLQALSDRCNEIAAAAMGKTIKSDENAEAVFQGKGGTETQMLNYRGGNPSLPGGIGNTGPTHVAEVVAYTGDQQTNPSVAVGHLGQQNMPTPWQDTASKYGRMDPNALKDRCREFGINQFVAPEVGEAFATHSVQEGPNRRGLDYTREKASDPYWIAMKETFLAAKVKLGQMRADEAEDALREYARQFQHYVDGPWSWHFAGVVAQTGGDWVTLENYNRDPDLKKAFLEAAMRAEQTHRAEIEVYKKGLDHEGETMQDISAKEPSFAPWAVPGLNQDLIRAGQNAIIQVPDVGSLWYFQMYGAKKGQTFHEAMAKTGDFTNPLTIRWRDQVTTDFVDSRKDDLDAKADTLRTRHRQGDARMFLDGQLPGILTKAKAEIDQAKTKPEVTEIYKQAIARIDSLDSLLDSLEDSDDLPTRKSPVLPGSRRGSL